MSFSSQLLLGTIYTAIAKYSSLTISLLITVFLARIISPEDFGTVAIASIVIMFFSTITTMGISPAIVQDKELSSYDINSIYSFTLLLSVIFALLFCAISPIIAFVYSDNQLMIVCCLLSLSVLFSFANIVPNALLLKQKIFKFIAIRTLIVQVIVGIFAIIAALKGAGLYALLINPVIGSMLIYYISIKNEYVELQMTTHIVWSSVKKIARFSIYQMMFNVLYLLYRNIDKLIIGGTYGMTSLGYYEKSYRFMMLPLENISGVIGPVLHPLLSDLQKDPQSIMRKYLKIQRVASFIGFPLSVLCYFSAEDLIILIFGEQWYPSVPIFRILALSVGIQVAQSSIGPVLQALGNPRKLFFASFFSFIVVLMSILIGLYFGGIELVALMLVVAFHMVYIIYHLFL